MKSLYDFGRTIVQIREAANSIEIKGRDNSAYIVFINNKCDELIESFDEIARRAEKTTPKSNINEETGGDLNEQNSGPAE